MDFLKFFVRTPKVISFWVIYTPSYLRSSIMDDKDIYLDEDGHWTENPKEAQRFDGYQFTVNLFTRSKKITL